jgi:hypothetical protein
MFDYRKLLRVHQRSNQLGRLLAAQATVMAVERFKVELRLFWLAHGELTVCDTDNGHRNCEISHLKMVILHSV